MVKMEETYEYMLPQPRDMQWYKEVIETMPQQILDITKTEQLFRHKISYRAIHLELIPEIIGLLIWWIISIWWLVMSYRLITWWEPITWVVLMLWEISILAGIFIYWNKSSVKQEIQNKKTN